MDKTVKTNILLRLFPEHIDDMPEFEATYDGAFRFVPKGAAKITRYLSKNKIKDFKFWAKNQEMALDRDEKGSDNHRKHNIAMGNMLPKVKQLKKKQVTSAKFKTISDEEMDEIAQELAKRKNVKNPDIVLCELISSKTK